ncbi:MAG: TonB family protein [Myxococcales bacterium]|nr:TonB family protein [Myxococcales bacterium]
MKREAYPTSVIAIPLGLWVAAAIVAHMVWAGSAEVGNKVIEQQLDVGLFADRVGGYFGSGSGANELEVSLLEIPREDPTPAKDDDQTPEEEAEPKEKSQEKPKDNPEVPLPDDPEKPKPPPPEPEKKVVEKKKPEEKKAPEEEKQKPQQLPDPKNRVAVQQHQEQDEEDNPDAEFIAEKARKVAEQTQARITSTDKNDPEPNPGATHSSAADNPGNAEESVVKQSEDSPGEMAQAPNDKATTPKPGEEASATPRVAGSGRDDLVHKQKADPEQKEGRDKGKEDSESKAKAASAGQEEEKGSKAVDGSPDLMTSPDGSDPVAPGRKAKKAKKGHKARKKRLPPPRRKNRLLGFGAGGKTKDGINLNLQQDSALDVMGRGELARLRKLDGERRRSKHRGTWKAVGLERWKSAIENYVAKVKPGNQTALNTARVPFARYLNEIHNRLHPVFADSFLASLSRLPNDHPMNRPDLRTNLEIIVSRTDGRLVDMGVTRSSGVTAFDVAALEAVKRASPFGAPPSAIVSPDGNVYLHWEFYRDPWYACSTYFARPFILKAAPGSKPPSVQPPKFGPREEGPGRTGSLWLPEELLMPDEPWLPLELEPPQEHASRD